MTNRVMVTSVDADPVRRGYSELVERKGISHSDSLCDGTAGTVSRQLSQFYYDEFGRIYHHNTNKVHLGAGRV